jgi:hypothetical protein
MYAVAAAGQREALPLPRSERGHLRDPQAQPVGIRHAVAAAFAGDPRPAALCGADIAGWSVCSAVIFDTSHSASCQRCAQLVAATTNTIQNRTASHSHTQSKQAQ